MESRPVDLDAFVGLETEFPVTKVSPAFKVMVETIVSDLAIALDFFRLATLFQDLTGDLAHSAVAVDRNHINVFSGHQQHVFVE